MRGIPTSERGQCRAFDDLGELAQIRAEEALKTAHDLHAVVFAGVVATGDHHAAVGVQVVHREVELGSRADADIDDARAARDQPRRQCSEDARPREPAVARDRDAGRLFFARRLQELGEPAPDALHERIAEIALGLTTDVVFAKNVRAHARRARQ